MKSKYLDEIKKVEKLLQDGDYLSCSMNCGRIIELSLKALFKKYAIDNNIEIPSPYNNKPIDRLTLGELVSLCEKTNVLTTYAREHELKQHDIRLLFSKLIVKIRNDASHEIKSDQEIEAKAGAYIIYGNLLLLQNPLCQYK